MGVIAMMTTIIVAVILTVAIAAQRLQRVERYPPSSARNASALTPARNVQPHVGIPISKVMETVMTIITIVDVNTTVAIVVTKPSANLFQNNTAKHVLVSTRMGSKQNPWNI